MSAPDYTRPEGADRSLGVSGGDNGTGEAESAKTADVRVELTAEAADEDWNTATKALYAAAHRFSLARPKSCQARFYVGSVACLANTRGSQTGTFAGGVE